MGSHSTANQGPRQPELRLLSDGRDVEGGNRPLEPLERALADRLHLDYVFDLCVEALRGDPTLDDGLQDLKAEVERR